ncbi:MAG TPA: gamma-glutamyltransferase [Firmicutes bacterium]|nr:gamma-glutamyltransferase [Bacillota bacterium]
MQLVMGTGGMVAAAHPLAAEAGLAVLRAGGNAVDAAITTNAVLNVTQPDMCGIGGDFFALIHVPGGETVFLNGSGRAPAAASPEAFAERCLQTIPLRGLLPVTVPGCVDAWDAARQRFGTWGWEDLLVPAIRYAREGFPVSARLAAAIEKAVDLLTEHPATARIYFQRGRAPRPGELLVQRDLGESLQAIANGGRDVFYQGALAAALSAYCQQGEGLLTIHDLQNHRSQWGQPVETEYRGYRILQTPPNTQGVAVLLLFNLMAEFDLAGRDPADPERVHWMVEATRIALAERNRYLTDPDFVPVPDMTGKDYADRLRRRITEMAAKSKTVPCEPGDTTYFAVVDEQGMVVSGIQSIFQPWGCGQVVPGTGIFLQNRGSYFSLQPQHVNVLQPGKRTAHTLCASLIMHHDEPFLVFGTMGGDGQAQTHLQVISNVLDGGMDIQEAISAPRWFHGRRDFGLGPEGLWLEGRFPSALVTALQARGHQVGVVEDYSEMMGHAQGIMIKPPGGTRFGAADPRGDGYVAAY